MQFEAMREKDKETLLLHVGEMYRESFRFIKERGTSRIEEQNGVYTCLQIKERIERILHSLPLEYALVIQKEFLEKKKKNWYVKYFSEKEYKTYKKAAVDTFLHCLYG